MKKLLVALSLVMSMNAVAQKFEGLALTPPMGWNSWNTFKTGLNEALVMDIADKMVSSGMAARGYIYLVLDEFGGRLGRAWRETAEEDANHETLIRDLMDGQYSCPARIVAFNTAEGWSRDVTVDVADELRRRFAEFDEVPDFVQAFLQTGSTRR